MVAYLFSMGWGGVICAGDSQVREQVGHSGGRGDAAGLEYYLAASLFGCGGGLVAEVFGLLIFGRHVGGNGELVLRVTGLAGHDQIVAAGQDAREVLAVHG